MAGWHQRSITPYLILLTVFLLQWLLLFSIKGPNWDGVSYYVYARSLLFDGDLDFANDYQLSYPTAGEHFASKELDEIRTSTGRVQNLFAVGTSMLWMPWLFLLRLVAWLNLVPGVDSRTMTGYETFFVGNISMFSAFIGFFAYAMSYHVAETVTSRWVALAATLTLMFATPLLYYQYREPMYSHTASAFTVALCIYVWWRELKAERFSAWQGLTLGFFIGLAGTVRWQNLAYLALPAVSSIIYCYRLPSERRREAWYKVAVHLLFVGIGALIPFAVQMIVWRILYGSFITIPQGSGFMDWGAPFLYPLLFSTFRGLLPWMPIFFLSGIGLLVLSRRSPQFAWPLLIMLLIVVYINGSTRDWFAGAGYGPRRLTSELALFVIGYAAFLQFLLPQRIRASFAVLIGILLGVHQWLLLRYGLPERLGGRVLSMNPSFQWEEEALSGFFADLMRLFKEALQDPSQVLLFAGTPLDVLLNQHTFPWSHLSVLLLSSLFVILVLGAVKLGQRLN